MPSERTAIVHLLGGPNMRRTVPQRFMVCHPAAATVQRPVPTAVPATSTVQPADHSVIVDPMELLGGDDTFTVLLQQWGYGTHLRANRPGRVPAAVPTPVLRAFGEGEQCGAGAAERPAVPRD